MLAAIDAHTDGIMGQKRRRGGAGEPLRDEYGRAMPNLKPMVSPPRDSPSGMSGGSPPRMPAQHALWDGAPAPAAAHALDYPAPTENGARFRSDLHMREVRLTADGWLFWSLVSLTVG